MWISSLIDPLFSFFFFTARSSTRGLIVIPWRRRQEGGHVDFAWMVCCDTHKTTQMCVKRRTRHLSPAQRRWRRWRWWWPWGTCASSRFWSAGTPARRRWRLAGHRRRRWTGPSWSASQYGIYWWWTWVRRRLKHAGNNTTEFKKKR